MLLKRLYAPESLKEGAKPKVVGVRVLRAGRKQKFSPELLAQGASQGWLEMANGKITLKGANETVVYRLVRTPGYYCSHCGEPMPDGKAAAAHVAAAHAGKASPDPENPAGYMKTNAYKGVREG